MQERDYAIISSYELKSELDSQPEPDIRLKSGMPTLDKAVDGFRPGELVVISGPTKHGKTLLAQSLTASFAEQNQLALWFSYEVPPRQFLSSFPELPLFYIPRQLKANALDWLVLKCRESFSKYHTRVVFIDHLHYLFDMARARTPSIEIGTVIRKLKTMAVQSELVVFLLCHTRKGGTEKMSYESIRDSSFVSQESDCVMMICRNVKTPGSNESRLRIEFHRRTGVLNKTVDLVKVGGYLREETKVDEESSMVSDAGRVEKLSVKQ